MTPIPRRLRRTARRAVVKLNLMPLIQPRRLDACCCGLSKTGTHSIAGLFDNYRALHHPDAEIRLDLAIGLLSGKLTPQEIEPVLKRRDRYLWLEMESSTLSGVLIESLFRVCPDKKYILTVRDLYSWSQSLMDHNINKPPRRPSKFAKLDRIRLRGDEFPHTEHDKPLLDRGLASLASYFSMWNDHNQRVLDTIPENRLLILNTSDILDRLSDIAVFVGVPEDTLRSDLGWQFAAPEKHEILSTLDPSYVSDTAERLCGEMMKRLLPGEGKSPNA